MVARFLLYFLMMLSGLFASAQTDTTAVDTNKVYTFVEQMPEYPGGDVELLKVFQKGIKYPKECLDDFGTIGRIPYKFIVERDGRVSNIELKNVDCPIAKKSIIETIAALKFRPGKHHGVIVRTQYRSVVNVHLN